MASQKTQIEQVAITYPQFWMIIAIQRIYLDDTQVMSIRPQVMQSEQDTTSRVRFFSEARMVVMRNKMACQIITKSIYLKDI